MQNCLLDFPFLVSTYKRKEGKLLLLLVHKDSLPMPEQMPSFGKLLSLLPSAKKKTPPKNPCSPPSPDWWSVLQWANNKAAQEVSASEAKAWKEPRERCPRRCSPSSPSASHWNPNSLAGDGDTVRAAGMQQLRQFGLRQLHPSAEPREQASPAR